MNLDNIAKKISNLDLDVLEIVRKVISQPEFIDIHDSEYHSYRYALSIQFLSKNFINEPLKVLELGEPGPFTAILNVFFPKWEINHQIRDLREGLDFDDDNFDLVISTEVLEHIADKEIGHEITSEGVRCHLQDVHRVLIEGGRLFLTTPNASSIWNIKRVLMQEPPLIYEKHYREFSHNELATLVKNAGLEIKIHQSLIVWNFWDFADIEEFMKSRGYDLSNRGDDQFMLASKVLKTD